MSTIRAAALAFFCAACCVPSIVAAQLPRERVHPEVVDSTWGRRTQAAWQLAWARQWSDAHAAFDVLHHQHPDAVEPLLGLAFVDRATWRYASAQISATILNRSAPIAGMPKIFHQ